MLAYDRVGSGEPLLLIHGIAHRRQAWQPVIDQLAQHYDVIAIDLPGHGESPRLDLRGRTVRDALTDELREFLARIGVERPHVVGNSLGGLIAIEMADAGLARSVTAFSPAGFWRGRWDFAYIQALFGGVQIAARLLAPVAPRLLCNKVARSLAFGWITAHPSRIDPDAAAGDLENMIASRHAIRTFLSAAYTYPAPNATAATEVPITIVWAGRDTVLLPYQARRARTVLPQATHRRLPGVGHVPMTDEPSLVVAAILAGARTADAEHSTQPAQATDRLAS